MSESHAALMDRIYRRQRHVYDMTRKYYLFGRDRLVDQLNLKPGARVLEVGCGTARNLVRIGQKYPQSKLFGLDASAAMLVSANRALRTAGLSERARLIQAYAEELSPGLFGESAPFDAILFSYSLSMIPDWTAALHAAVSALAPEGRLHIVDFGDLKGMGWPLKSLLRRWLHLFHVEPREELLNTLEREFSRGDGLVLLPGRYAFVLSCSAEEAKKKRL